jgi:hypothetical protein
MIRNKNKNQKHEMLLDSFMLKLSQNKNQKRVLLVFSRKKISPRQKIMKIIYLVLISKRMCFSIKGEKMKRKLIHLAL